MSIPTPHIEVAKEGVHRENGSDAGRPTESPVHCREFPRRCRSDQRRQRHAWLYRQVQGKKDFRDGIGHGHAEHRYLFL